jgi:hypothetical protein
VCLWCGLVAERFTKLVLAGDYDATEVLGPGGERYIAVFNHEKVDQHMELIYRNHHKAASRYVTPEPLPTLGPPSHLTGRGGGRCLELLSPYDAALSLQAVRALFLALSKPVAGADDDEGDGYEDEDESVELDACPSDCGLDESAETLIEKFLLDSPSHDSASGDSSDDDDDSDASSSGQSALSSDADDDGPIVTVTAAVPVAPAAGASVSVAASLVRRSCGSLASAELDVRPLLAPPSFAED